MTNTRNPVSERVTVILAAIENARRAVTIATLNGASDVAVSGIAASELAKVIMCKDAYNRTVEP